MYFGNRNNGYWANGNPNNYYGTLNNGYNDYPVMNTPANINQQPVSSGPMISSCRFVQNESEIRPGEISMDGVSVFVQLDGKKVILKNWDNTGTINTSVYNLEESVFVENTEETKPDPYDLIMDKLNGIEQNLLSALDKTNAGKPQQTQKTANNKNTGGDTK